MTSKLCCTVRHNLSSVHVYIWLGQLKQKILAQLHPLSRCVERKKDIEKGSKVHQHLSKIVEKKKLFSNKGIWLEAFIHLHFFS